MYLARGVHCLVGETMRLPTLIPQTLPWSAASVCVALLGALGCEAQEPVSLEVTVENISPETSIYAANAMRSEQPLDEPGVLGSDETWSCVVPARADLHLQVLAKLDGFDDVYVAAQPGGLPIGSGDGDLAEGRHSSALALWDAGDADQPKTSARPPHRAPISPFEFGVDAGSDGPTRASEAEALVDLSTRVLDDSTLEVRLHNRTSDDATVPTPIGEIELSAGVCLVMDPDAQVFAEGAPASAELLALASEGDPQPLLRELPRLSSSLSSVLWAQHDGDAALYDPGELASPGLEQFAEDGFVLTRLHELDFSPTVDAHGLAAPTNGWELAPGQRVRFELDAYPGDRLTLMSAYFAANDFIVGTSRPGIPLFDQGVPNIGEQEVFVQLVDVGTEVDEAPGIGPNQYARQPAPGGGWVEDARVEIVDHRAEPWAYPRASEIMRVSVALVEDDPS